MRSKIVRTITAAILVASLWPVVVPVAAADESSDRVQRSLDALDRWLNTSTYGGGWHDYLNTSQLRDELAKGAAADADSVAAVLQIYHSNVPGLEKRRFAAVRSALAAWVAQLSTRQASQLGADQLPAAVLAAKGSFMPPTAGQLQAARSAVRNEARRLDNFLSSNPSWSYAWKEYLGWQTLQQQLGQELPEPADLNSVVKKLSENHAGLEHPRFMALRSSLRAWLDVYLAANKTDAVRKRIDSYSTELADKLKDYGPQSAHWDSIDIASRIRFMERFGVATDVAAAVRRHHSYPNFEAYVSEKLIAAGMNDRVDEPITIQESIMGARIVGSGHTTGNIEFDLVRHSNRAALNLQMRGNTTARTTGYKSGVQVYSNSSTRLEAEKRIRLAQTGLTASPASARAWTSTRVNGLSTSRRFGRRLVERMAWRKIAKTKGQAQREAAGKAAGKLRRRIDTQASELVANANEKYQTKFRNPLVRKKAFPRLFDVRSTESAIVIRMLEATADQLAAPVAAQPPPAGADMAVRMHESFANNFAAVALGGTTYRSEDAKKSMVESEMLQKFILQREDNLRERREAEGRAEAETDEEEEPPWEMVFARRNPVSLEFRDGTIKFTIRGVKFVGLDDTVYKRSMSIWGVYDVEIDKYGGLRLTLKDHGVDPTAVETGGKFVPADAPVRSKLRARLTAALEGENGEKKIIEIFPLQVPDERGEKIGKLAYTHFESKHGWLTLTWDRIVKKEVRQAARPHSVPRALESVVSTNR